MDTYRAEQANDIPDDDRPTDIVIADLVKQRDDLTDLVRSLQTENAQLQRAVRELKDVSQSSQTLYSPDERGHGPYGKVKSTW